MKSKDDIHSLIKKLHVEPSADMDANVHGRITQALEEWKQTTPASGEPNIWRIIMKSKLTKVAVAAVVMIGVIIGVGYFGGRMDGSSVAWAQVAERVQKTKAFVYHMHMTSITEGAMTVGDQTIDIPDMEMNWNCIFSQEYGIKIETFTTTNEKTIMQLMYIIPSENRMVMVMPEQKQYMSFEFDDDVVKNMQEQQEKNDPRNMFKQVMDCEHVELGRKVINGIEVEGLETTDPKYGGGMFEEIVARIWVEVETGWPVLMEMDAVMESPVSEGLIEMHGVTDGFQWDVQVDPEEFVPDIPEDYSEMANFKMPKMDAEGAIQGFELCVELTGHYPEKLNVMSLVKEMTGAITELKKELKPREIEKEVLETNKHLPAQEVIELLRQRLKEEYSERLPELLLQVCVDKSLARAKRKLGIIEGDSGSGQGEPEIDQAQMQQMMQMMMPIQSLVMFYMQLVQQDKDPHYYGDRVEPGDTEQILLIWKGDDGKYEVIYGDLSHAVLAPDQVPPLDDGSQEP